MTVLTCAHTYTVHPCTHLHTCAHAGTCTPHALYMLRLTNEQKRPASGMSAFQEEDSAPLRRLSEMLASLLAPFSLLSPQGLRHSFHPKIALLSDPALG